MKDKTLLKGMLIGALIIILIIAIGAGGKYGYNKLSDKIYIRGGEYGYNIAINQLMNEALKCQQVPIMYQNETYNIILVECLQQGAES